MCGNWGMLCLAAFASEARRRGETFPKGLEDLLRQVLTVVEMRGAQAGGVLAMFASPTALKSGVEAIRVRTLKPKRGNLCHELFRKLAWNLCTRRLLNPLGCLSRPHESVLMQGHSRFGTSSAPALIETHPHQWTPCTKTHVWVDDPAHGWVRRLLPLTLTITHNGDFDAWKPYRDAMVGVGALGLWLDRVLGVCNYANGDSAKLAGVMELLACQGIWLHAVRLAYHLNVAVHVEQATGWHALEPGAPSTVPDRATFQAWADVFDSEFALVVQNWIKEQPGHPLDDDGHMSTVFVHAVVERLQTGPVEKSLHQWVAQGEVRAFVAAAAAAFRDNDLLVATTAFLRRAEGTFGVTVTSTRFPETVVMAAKGQPMSVGFGGLSRSWSPSIALWSSEPSALGTVVEAGGLQARLDLDDQWGEILQLKVRTALDGRYDEENSPQFAVQLKDSFADETTYLEATGLQFGKQQVSEEDWQPTLMTAKSFRSRLTWLAKDDEPVVASAIKERATASPNGLQAKDPVAHDMKDIPSILNEIDLCWSDTRSLNYQSASHFADLLLSRMSAASAPRPEVGAAGPDAREVDLLVIGIENSLWLAQQFCADLTQLFPRLRAVALSSNVALGLLQSGPGQMHPYNFVYGKDNFNVSQHTIGLVLSHSGTTYPTVWAARFLHQRTRHVFGLASSFDCLLSVSIGQAPGEAFTRRLFSSGAGIRPAEAATVATVAMHHTLSHLLLRCAAIAKGVRLPSLQQHARTEIVKGSAGDRRAPDSVEPNLLCVATEDAVQDMQRVLLSLYFSACAACGVDGLGQPLSPQHREMHTRLRQAGHRWSHHITEGYWATFVPAAYVLITVAGGIPPVTSLGSLLMESQETSEQLKEGMIWFFRFLDALLYVFLPIIVAMIHRVCTGRRLWARFTTRTLLVVESTVNYKLLRAYASKLLALSWRFATISVVGQNGTDHFVHEYTHKAQSDVLVALGRPDGRLHTTSSAEASILMSVQQAKFIKKRGKGIEVYSLGHNPWSRPGLCSEVLTLPTLRPLFAGEKILMHDRMLAGTGHGSHGLHPAELLHRWSDLLQRQMDPMGMPGIRLSVQALGQLTDLREKIPFKEALRLLEKLMDEQRLKAKAEPVPLFLQSFLEVQLAKQPTWTSSPGKSYTQSPSKQSEQSAEKNSVRSPGKSYVNSPSKYVHSPSKISQLSAGSASSATRLARASSASSGHHASPAKFQLTAAEDANESDGRSKPEEQEMSDANPSDTRRISPKDDESFGLDPHKFLALLHGSELQNWARNMRYRFNMFRKLRGMIGLLSEEQEGKMDLQSVVLYGVTGGITLSSIFLAWKSFVQPQGRISKSTTEAVPAGTSMQDACLSDGARALARHRHGTQEHLVALDSEWTPEESVPVGQRLLDSGTREAAVLDGLRSTELFHEARVASAERLIGWYVLFHAMVEPSSRLPFLGYELGKSESRLRVASTPAPVAVHAGALGAAFAASAGEPAAKNGEGDLLIPETSQATDIGSEMTSL